MLIKILQNKHGYQYSIDEDETLVSLIEHGGAVVNAVVVNAVVVNAVVTLPMTVSLRLVMFALVSVSLHDGTERILFELDNTVK